MTYSFCSQRIKLFNQRITVLSKVFVVTSSCSPPTYPHTSNDRWAPQGWVRPWLQCYLVQSLYCWGGAVVLKSCLSLLRSLQEILNRGRLPGALSWPGPLQGPVELLGESQVVLRICGQLLLVQPWVSAGWLTLSTEPCCRGEILDGLRLGLRRGARRSTGRRDQDRN